MDSSKFDYITNQSVEEIEHKLRQFQANFENSVHGLGATASFSDMEKALEEIVHDTRKTYLDTLSHYLSSINEKEIVQLKKENTRQRGSPSRQTKR